MKIEAEDLNVHYPDGKLHVYEEGLYGLLFKTVPKTICKSIEKLGGVNKIYVIDLVNKEQFFGNVIIFLKEETAELKNKRLIETFIKQASIAILKRQAEEALRINEEKLNQIINSSPIGICTVDMLGNFITTNPAYERMVGYAKEELVGLSFFDVTHPNDRPKNKKLFQDMFSLETTDFSMKKRYVRKDGEEIKVSIHAIGVRDAEGSVRFGTAFVDDITESNLHEAKLTKAKELAEENNNLKSAFLRNMSHEIRTPMNGIMGFSNLMLEAEGNQKNEYAMIVQKSSEQLLALVDDLLLISRLQSEKTSIKNVEFSPAELIMDISKIFKLDNINDNLDIIINIPDQYKDLTVLADVDKIKHIISNFSSNAVKYTSKGSIELGFDITNKDIEFYAKDTGMGIPKHEQKLIFDNFHRGGEAISRAIRGTGLGLCIANELAKIVNGKIGVSSEPKHGSRFHLTIPLKK
jgi:PAS domain S-box-containing protein